MLYAYTGAYLLVAVLFGWWQVAMDRQYGVLPAASKSPVPMILLALDWPLGIPLAMASVAGGGWGRWPLRQSEED